MSAPTLPTRTERDRLRGSIEKALEHPPTMYVSDATTAKRLLDWADTQEQVERDEECSRRVTAKLDARPSRPIEGPARRALRRLVAAVRHDSADFGSSVITDAGALTEAEAVLAGGQAPEREVCGYVWRSPSGGCTQYWYANDPDDEERLTIEQCRAEAHEARETCGGTIRKLTRPVRQPDDGEGRPR